VAIHYLHDSADLDGQIDKIDRIDERKRPMLYPLTSVCSCICHATRVEQEIA
jgi:hypothetical protein